MGSGASQDAGNDSGSGVCCCKGSSPRGEISENGVQPKSAVEFVEHGLNMARLGQELRPGNSSADDFSLLV